MVAKSNQNKCPPENKHFLTELNTAYAKKIKVQHIGAVRNESKSEEKNNLAALHGRKQNNTTFQTQNLQCERKTRTQFMW